MEIVGPRMESWWTASLIGHSGQDFPSRMTKSGLLQRKNKRNLYLQRNKLDSYRKNKRNCRVEDPTRNTVKNTMEV